VTRLVVVLASLLSIAAACDEEDEPPRSATPPTEESTGAEASEDPALASRREQMVDRQIAARGVRDTAVLRAMRTVPRHRFVPEEMVPYAYEDRPLPIGWDQTISQPYIVAFMTELSGVGEGDEVLEIGTGSGYQAAVFAELGAEVYSIEIVEPLGRRAAETLEAAGYDVETKIGDGYVGWPEHAPFDAIVLTAAPPEIPQPLLDQLAVGGRLIAPVGTDYQELVVVTRTDTGYERSRSLPVMFVPMTGRAQEED
jgi:protein-L-isoaspartate(D-aspartate) O-methyltransferase